MIEENAGTVVVPESLESEHNLSTLLVSALSYRTKTTCSILLNPIKEIPTDENIPRDWRGLAALAEIPSQLMPTLQTHSDPTGKILAIWGQNATVQELLDIMERIDRWDVIHDTQHMLEEDFRKNQWVAAQNSIDQSPQLNNTLITSDDVIRKEQGRGIQTYDAFVLFAEQDINFAQELIQRMEHDGFKLCYKARDLLGDITSEHEAILRLIAERCYRLIVIFSTAFFESPVNSFLVSYTHFHGISQNNNKIVPCRYQECVVPLHFAYYSILDHQKNGRIYNFWEKLRISLLPLQIVSTTHQTTVSTIVITEIESPSPSGPLSAIRSSSRQSDTSSPSGPLPAIRSSSRQSDTSSPSGPLPATRSSSRQSDTSSPSGPLPAIRSSSRQSDTSSPSGPLPATRSSSRQSDTSSPSGPLPAIRSSSRQSDTSVNSIITNNNQEINGASSVNSLREETNQTVISNAVNVTNKIKNKRLNWLRKIIQQIP